jgi:DNA segregation ATPase FtsK/SpoIIIE, S-DNA-T family
VSKGLSTTAALELIEQLRATIEDLTGRAGRLNSELQVRTSRERRACEAAIAEENRRLAGAQAEADVSFQNARASQETRHKDRKTLIGKAYQSSKDRALQRIDDDIGARKYELQKRMLQAERDRDAALAKSAAEAEEFGKILGGEQDTLAQLERAVQKSFGGYRTFRRLFFRAYEQAENPPATAHPELLRHFRGLLEQGRGELGRMRRRLLLRLFRYLPLWLILALLPAAGALVLPRLGFNFVAREQGLAISAGALVLVVIGRQLLKSRSLPLVTSLSRTLANARKTYDGCQAQSHSFFHSEVERIRSEYQTTSQEVDKSLKQAMAEASELRISCRMEADQRTVGITARHEHLCRARLQRLERAHQEATKMAQHASQATSEALAAACEEKLQTLQAKYAADWQALEAEWNGKLQPVYETLAASRAAAEKLSPGWEKLLKQEWVPPQEFSHIAKYGELKVALDKLCAALPKDKRLSLPGTSDFCVPLSLCYPAEGSILFETSNTGQTEVIGALNNIILRLLANAPPGRLNFTVIDPVGLGQNFAGVMHMADYEEQIISGRIWTQSTQIEQRLADLNEHMEKVIQMYLRNEYQTIAEYNEQAGVIAEKYHFLVIADFPANFTETACKRILSIAASGAKCGVYTLIHWDQRQPLPQDFLPDELRKSSVAITVQGGRFVFTGKPVPGTELMLDPAPTPELATEFVHQVGRKSKDSSRVEVPFEHVIPPAEEIWTGDTTSELRVPIGRTGATKLQYLAIGKGTRQHGLIAGKTGSGKSTLFHVIITNLALWCSPEQVEFYLVDFKKGVEFKCYATQRLPHARVVAIESDREFGLSVLQRVDDVLKHRGDLFRKLGAQDIAGYKRAGGTEPMPRCLLLIDEFQELFVEDDKISQTASLLMDRIVRQGRAFGIHVLLGSQTLGGAYTVARTTLGQMVIRIALQCNEADAYLIMDDNNPAPRLLSRPGEGIYNDSAGSLEGNSPFQVVWLPDHVRDRYLSEIRERATRNGQESLAPIVFEGNAPADVRENDLLRKLLLDGRPVKAPHAARIWLGAPNSIKGPTEAVFQRQSGNNLLIVGQREEAVLAMFTTALLSLGVQYPRGSVRLILCDSTPPGSPQQQYLETVIALIPHEIRAARPGQLSEVMKGVFDEFKSRSDDPDPDAKPPVFLFILGLQRFNRLRYEEDFSFSSSEPDAETNPAAVLNQVLSEGTRLGLHVIASCDTYNNVNRFMNRKALSEFEMRLLFQMSANDSASLIDSPKASLLGLHRALFYNAQEGYLETFRPYALPDSAWLSAQLKREQTLNQA